jgi:antitoxin (DNA-binding transcriptional repressor) of toxin-antitoxin stability system
MDAVNTYYAKTHLSKLLERVASGEEVVIAKGGQPVAKLVPFTAAVRRPGSLRGRLRLGPEFDDPLPDELLRAFSGEDG